MANADCKPCCFLGRGEIYLKPHESCCDPSAPATSFLSLGEVSKGQINIKSNDVKQMSHMDGSGGVACAISIVEEMTFDLTLSCFNADTIAILAAATGTQDNVVATVGATSDWKVASKEDAFPLGSIPDISVAPTIPTLTFGTDFKWSRNGTGIVLLGTALAQATVGTTITVTYNAKAQTNLQMLTGKNGRYSLWYDGVNLADGKKIQLRLRKIIVSAAKSIDLIGDNKFATFDITGTALRDECDAPVAFLPGQVPSFYGQIIQG